MSNLPQGTAFLRTLIELEDQCANQTWRELSHAGQLVPRCLTALGDLLSLTHQASSCSWGCAGPDHTANYLAGRVATAACASLRCLGAGYYDEALLLTRSVGELANLLVLFVRCPADFERWKRATRTERLNHFSPLRVRLALEKIDVEPPIDNTRYTALSETGAHVTPDTVPECHNPYGRAVLGAIFQLPGAIMALTELSIATSVAAHQASRLLELPPEVRAEFDTGMRTLVESLPGIDIMNIQDLLASLDESSEPRN